MYPFIAFSCCLIWCECCVWLCVLFSPCYHPFCVKMWLCASEVCVRKKKTESVLKFASELRGWRGWMFDKFPLKVCVWSGYECIFYVLWIKGKSEIKNNLTRYNTLLTVTYFWLYINWTTNTLIHMYRDLGHGQPRFSSESRLEWVMEELKPLVGGPVQTNNGIAAWLPKSWKGTSSPH